MSILKVDTIQEKTSGNGVVIPSGQTLDVSAGTLVPSAGAIMQTIQGTASTRVTQNTAAHVDTGLTANITPSSTSSKILITVSQHGLDKRTDNAYMELQLHADGTNIYQPNEQLLFTANSDNHTGSTVFSYLHSPSTTSAVTYKTVFRCPPARNQVSVQWSGSTSTIVLQEIAG